MGKGIPRRFAGRRARPLVAAALALATLALVPSRANAGWLSSLIGLFKPQPPKNPATGPLSVTAGAHDEIKDLIASAWVRMRPELEKSLRTAIAAQAGQRHGQLLIDRLSVRSLDFSRPPKITITPIDDGQKRILGITFGKPHYAGEMLELDLPGDAAGWSLAIDGHVSYDLDVNLGFTHLKQKIQSDLSIDATKLRAAEKVQIDTVTDPLAPAVKKLERPALDFDLKIRTHKLIADALLVVLKPVMDAVLRYELGKAIKGLDPLLASMSGKPGKPYGTGGAFTPFPQRPDLEKAAKETSEDIANDHTPFGTVYECEFSSPVYRQGTVTGWDGMGDSPIWTGSWLTGEALRHAATRDPVAVANAKKVIAGLKLLLDVQDPASGRLSRYAIPTSHPFARQFIPPSGTMWIATVNGQDYVCQEDISRDQHTGAIMGLAAAYDFIDDPAVKAGAKSLIQRVVDFLESTGWNALRRDNSVSAPFVQSPGMIVAFTAAAERTDPQKYGAMRARHGRVVSYDWIGTLMGALDPIQDYYKWNLGHTTSYTALRLETDPDRARHLERGFAIMRRAVGHHRQAWFSAVEAALDPAARARLAPVIEDDMSRMVSRPRRQFAVDLRNDPTIEKDQYQAGLQVPGGTLNLPMGALQVGTPPRTLAKYPVPAEKRPVTDFLWQRNPFDLEGGGSATRQAPGVDIVLPYWVGRHYGFLR